MSPSFEDWSIGFLVVKKTLWRVFVFVSRSRWYLSYHIVQYLEITQLYTNCCWKYEKAQNFIVVWVMTVIHRIWIVHHLKVWAKQEILQQSTDCVGQSAADWDRSTIEIHSKYAVEYVLLIIFINLTSIWRVVKAKYDKVFAVNIFPQMYLILWSR